MRMWEIREGRSPRDSYGNRSDEMSKAYEEGYECGYSEGYGKAMKEASGRYGERSYGERSYGERHYGERGDEDDRYMGERSRRMYR